MSNLKVCSIDPAFKHCGFVVINSQDFSIEFSDNVDFLQGYQKSNQTEYTKRLWKAIQAAIQIIDRDHKPDVWVIENQIGKFACVQVLSMLICAIMPYSDKIVCQSPKFKLADDLGLSSYVTTNSNQYNQNKMRAKAICKHFLTESHQTHIAFDRDIADSILQAVYYIQHTLGHKLDYSTLHKDQPSLAALKQIGDIPPL